MSLKKKLFHAKKKDKKMMVFRRTSFARKECPMEIPEAYMNSIMFLILRQRLFALKRHPCIEAVEATSTDNETFFFVSSKGFI